MSLSIQTTWTQQRQSRNLRPPRRVFSNGDYKVYLTTDIAHLSEFDFRYNAQKGTDAERAIMTLLGVYHEGTGRESATTCRISTR